MAKEKIECSRVMKSAVIASPAVGLTGYLAATAGVAALASGAGIFLIGLAIGGAILGAVMED